MGTFIGFLVGVASSFAAYLNTKCGFLGYLCVELSAGSALLLPCAKQSKRQGRGTGSWSAPITAAGLESRGTALALRALGCRLPVGVPLGKEEKSH